MFEIRSPRLTVAKLIVVKNDPGAELTLISPTLYDWAKDKGILFNEIISTRAAAVSFTAGAKAEVNTAAHLHVYLPNMNIPVSIQVLSMPGMTDCVNEILLGLDNTEVLGLELSIRNRTSTYHSVPNALEPIVSTHIPLRPHYPALLAPRRPHPTSPIFCHRHPQTAAPSCIPDRRQITLQAVVGPARNP
jgi:hypothetical protein